MEEDSAADILIGIEGERLMQGEKGWEKAEDEKGDVVVASKWGFDLALLQLGDVVVILVYTFDAKDLCSKFEDNHAILNEDCKEIHVEIAWDM